MTPFEIVLAALEAHGCQPKVRGQHAAAHCPTHDDSTPSLEVDVGEDGIALLHCFVGCEPKAVVAAIGLRMSDLFPRTAETRKRAGPRTRKPAGVQEFRYSISPGFLIEFSDAMCLKLYSYLDLRQGSRGRLVRGDQEIANALGCQARTVRTHAEHLAGAGSIRIYKHVTETGAHKGLYATNCGERARIVVAG
ncbi:MAG: hypothetical protein ACLQIJ_09565 [Polyangia bacterium]